MDHRNKLADLHKESLQKLEETVASNTLLAASERKKIHDAQNEWQNAWIKLEEALLILEKIEI
ncbi:MAG TPA: hypothetical protein VK559_04090 [Ferruginibacter sp.]|nr:hypothetical protein [Ferruginibacter sp.]